MVGAKIGRKIILSDQTFFPHTHFAPKVLGGEKVLLYDRPVIWVENEPFFTEGNYTFVNTMRFRFGYFCKAVAQLELLCTPRERSGGGARPTARGAAGAGARREISGEERVGGSARTNRGGRAGKGRGSIASSSTSIIIDEYEDGPVSLSQFGRVTTQVARVRHPRDAGHAFEIGVNHYERLNRGQRV